MTRSLVAGAVLCLLGAVGTLRADPPVASYIFPAGGQRGKTVEFRVGGLYLHQSCSFEMTGPGVQASSHVRRVKTPWFEGPLLPLPDSQQAEDYPRDMAGRVTLAPDAPLGLRSWQLATDQGATAAMRFMVGDLPEIIEQEIDGDPVPVEVRLPVTINGRIFPRENVDIWSFAARRGQSVCCEVHAARLGSPLDSRLEVRDPQGRIVAENDDTFGADSFVRFTPAADGAYQVRIHDVNLRGGQAYVYRLTLTADAHVDRTYPLGGKRGDKVRFELAGQGLPEKPVTIALPDQGARDHVHRLEVGGKLTNPFLLDLDDLPEYLESEPNDERRQALTVRVPAVCNGRIGTPGDVDYWAFTATKGQALDIELRAGRLGSPLEGILVVLDASGKELARADATAANLVDPSLHFTAPADGTFSVRIADRFRGRGGPAFAYRLRIAPPPPADFQLQLTADALTVNRGGQAKLKVAVERQGSFPGPITLALEGLPAGVTASGTTIPSNQPGCEITLNAGSLARVQTGRLTVRGMAKVGEQTVTHTAVLRGPRGTPEQGALLLAVAVPTPFKVVGEYDMGWAARGTVHHRRYRLERGGYTGALQVSLADRQARHLQGVTGPTITVPAGATEFDYPVSLPPWMETGRTCRVCVMAVGTIKDPDGSEHTVSFTSLNQNEQVVAVVQPERLGLEILKQSVTAVPGETISVPLRVLRGKSLKGPAKVELVVPVHIQGLTAEPVIVTDGSSDAILTLRCASEMTGAFNMPMLIRATVLEKGEPVIGEAKLEVRR